MITCLVTPLLFATRFAAKIVVRAGDTRSADGATITTSASLRNVMPEAVSTTTDVVAPANAIFNIPVAPASHLFVSVLAGFHQHVVAALHKTSVAYVDTHVVVSAASLVPCVTVAPTTAVITCDVIVNVHSFCKAVIKVPVALPCVTATPALCVIPCEGDISNIQLFCVIVAPTTAVKTWVSTSKVHSFLLMSIALT